jgi:predicted acetyltransferase
MAVEFRPARPEEMREFAYSGQVAFGGSTADDAVEREMRWPMRAEWTLCAFDDGVMASKMGTIPLVMRWNGRDVACGGVSAVTTLPSHRRRGYLRELMTRAFAAMRDEGRPLAMLWASMAAIYQRFGFGVGFTGLLYDFDPRHLRFVDDLAPTGRTRLLAPAEARPAMEPIYRRFAEGRTLMLHREPFHWDHFVMDTWGPDAPPPLVVAYEEAVGRLGYAIYTVDHRRRDVPGPNQQVVVRELVWLTAAAHRALVGYFAGYDLADSVRILRLPSDDPLFHHAQEPRLLNTRVRDGTLVRIIDLVPALEGRGYGGDGSVTLGLVDDLCPWNTGAWRLTVEGGQARVKPCGDPPELHLTPRPLAMLASGHQSASMLARAGIIPPAEPATLRTADATFATDYAPYCIEGF